MKIGLICTEKLPVPSIRGGAIQILIDGYVPYLSNSNEVTVFCVEDTELDNREINNNVEYIRLPKDGYRYNVAKVITELYKSKQKFDLLHVFNRPKDLLIYKSASPESRFVLSLHNEMFKEGKISFELGNLVIDACDRIITVSEYITNTVIHRFPKAYGKTVPFYSGVNVKRYSPIYQENIIDKRKELRKKYGITNEKVILFVGRLSKVKGVDILIEAFYELQKKVSNIILLIVGSKWFSDDSIDDYGKKLRDMVSNKKINNVEFTGFIKPEDIPDVFLVGDIFVCASQWQEPLARVHYEAMASGLPIITTNRGGNAELFKNNNAGIVVNDFTNPQTFCNEIERLLNNPDICLKMGREAYDLACNIYDFSNVHDRIICNYNECFSSEKTDYDCTSIIQVASEVLQEYPIVYDSIEVITFKQKKTIYKIHTSNGYTLLKRLSSKHDKICDMINKIQTLVNKQYNTPKIIKAYSGKHYVEYEGYYYILFDYIQGRKPDYGNEYDLKLLVTGIAEMHLCSEQDCGKNDNILRNNINKYETSKEEMLAIFDEINQKSLKNEFDITFSSSLQSIIELYNRSNDYMNMLLNNADENEIQNVICHNDYVAGNTTIDEKGKLYVFDMDSLNVGIGVKDIRKLCNKIMKERNNGWDLRILKNIYTVYSRVRNMSRKEIIYLLMELEFPHLFIEQVFKYYRNSEANWTFDKYLSNLKKAIKTELSKKDILDCFAEYVLKQ